MTTLLDKYQIDMSSVRQLEGMVGMKLPDLFEPVRKLDADVDAIQAQVGEYSALADEIEALHDQLVSERSSHQWVGGAAEAADDVWDVILAILKAIAGVIIFIVGVLLLVIGALIRVIGELFALIASIVEWIENVIFVVVVGIGGVLFRGKVLEIFRLVERVFGKRIIGIVGIIGIFSGLIAQACDIAGRGVMWLGYYLMEFGAKLGGDDKFADGIHKERDKVFD